MSTKWVSFVDGARCVGEQGGACAAVAPAAAAVPAVAPVAAAVPAIAPATAAVSVAAAAGGIYSTRICSIWEVVVVTFTLPAIWSPGMQMIFPVASHRTITLPLCRCSNFMSER